MKQTFDFYCDPGHGWVKVAKDLLKYLGIEKEITPYSYQRGNYAYLEEDCDASTLITALQAKNIEYSFREHHTNRSSKIRSYSMYSS